MLPDQSAVVATNITAALAANHSTPILAVPLRARSKRYCGDISAKVRSCVLEAEFAFKQAVLGLGVLASIGAVQSLVRAHDRSNISLDSVGERPQIRLMHCPIVDIAGDGFLILGGETSVLRKGRVPLGLLFVADVVLGRGLDTCILEAHDSLSRGDTSEILVRRETFPVTASIA
ncbi:putative beta-glucosidase [Hortaea werneckii]|nr:putative beta-glucosidase [Hortaea werneckii]